MVHSDFWIRDGIWEIIGGSWASQVALKNLPADAGHARDLSLTPGSERVPGEGHGNPLEYSCLENSMDRGVGQAIVHGVHCTYTHIIHMLKKFS